MVVSCFVNKGGKFECVNVKYAGINHPMTIESHQIFNDQLKTISKERGWEIYMFNPLPEEDDNIEMRKTS